MAVTRVTTDGITDSAVNSAKIGVDVIAAEDLAANSVTVSEISDGAVAAAKLADGAVTHAKLHSAALSPITIDQTNNRVGIGVTPTTNHALTLHDTSFRQLAMTGNRPTIFMKESDGSANQNFQVRVDEGQFRIQQQNDGQTNAVTKMQITQEGYVTTPSQPMVRMSLGSHFGVGNVHPSGPGAKITGFTVHENIGSHWNNSNSNFTCPVAGVYCVSIFWIKYPASGAAHVDLHKNGSAFNAIRWRGHEGGTSYHQVGGTVFVTCAANDVLHWSYFGAPGIHDGNGQWGIRLVG